MRVTIIRDESDVEIRLTFPAGHDPDHAADLAWTCVSRVLSDGDEQEIQ